MVQEDPVEGHALVFLPGESQIEEDSPWTQKSRD